MKKTTIRALAASILAGFLLITGPVMAEEMSHAGHGAPPATNIRNAEVKGYKIAYHLMAMKNSTSTPMPGMKSHHLMIYVMDASGKPVTNAQTGFLVVGPDKANQKAMAMAMGDGYGADLDFKKGAYAITTKLMIGTNKTPPPTPPRTAAMPMTKVTTKRNKVVDEFTYTAP